jgi:hypothetical protein
MGEGKKQAGPPLERIRSRLATNLGNEAKEAAPGIRLRSMDADVA